MNYKFIKTEYLESVSGGDIGIARELTDMFREQSKEIYGELMAKLSAGDYLSLSQLAHKAKSSVAIMGMDELATMLKTFELQARDRIETEMYESYISRFKNEIDAAVIELEDYLKNA